MYAAAMVSIDLCMTAARKDRGRAGAHLII